MASCAWQNRRESPSCLRDGQISHSGCNLWEEMKHISQNSVADTPADVIHLPHRLIGESPPTPDSFQMITALHSKAKRFDSVMNLMDIT
jgi:hypothetical protein